MRGINRLFDWLDNSVDTVDQVLNRKQRLEADHKTRRSKRREIIDTDPAPAAEPQAKAPKAATSTSTGLAKKPHFYIMESVDPASGKTLYVVTDGRVARTECATREFAVEILRALEKAP
jgi:hypothetical protein